MKTLLGICITSGIKGPEIELTAEQSKEITELALQLDKPWTGSKFAGHGLSPDHYFVHWTDENAEVLGLRTTMIGYVSMWKKGDTDWHEFEDTNGLWAKLAPMAGQAYKNWIKEAEEALDEANSEFFGMPIYKIHNP